MEREISTMTISIAKQQETTRTLILESGTLKVSICIRIGRESPVRLSLENSSNQSGFEFKFNTSQDFLDVMQKILDETKSIT